MAPPTDLDDDEVPTGYVCPTLSAYVLARINVRKALESENASFLDDAELMARADKLETNYYVGFVSQVRGLTLKF
jgi:hypothetical protein